MEQKLPRWIDIGLLPVINILAAFIVAGVIIALIGENPFAALAVLVKGAFFYKGALGYTLFYELILFLPDLLSLLPFMPHYSISAVKVRQW